MSSSRVIVLPTCSICQDEDAGLDIVATLCGHAFHSNCIRQWDFSRRILRQPTKCPACNVDLQRPTLPVNSNSRFIRLHSLTEKTINSPTQPPNDSEIQAQWQHSQAELRTLKETVREKNARIRALTVEPESLKRERDALISKVRAQERTMQEMENSKKNMSIEHRRKHAQLVAQQTDQSNELQRLVIESKKLNDKCRTLKNDRDQLQEQMTQKISENEELQSFVSDFSREKKKFEVVEAELRAELQESLKQSQTLKIANQACNRKLEESKKKINFLESQFGAPGVSTSSTRNLSASVRHCNKFLPEASKSSIVSPNAAVRTPKGKGKQREVSAQSSYSLVPRDITYQLAAGESSRTKRFRIEEHRHNEESPSDSEDIVFCSRPSNNIPSSSPSTHYNKKVEENLILPSLFGDNSSKAALKRSISSSSKNTVKPLKPLPHLAPRLFNPSLNVAGSSSFISSDKLVAIGPKIRHR